MRDVAIVGAGGFAQEAYWTMRDIAVCGAGGFAQSVLWNVIGFIDDTPAAPQEYLGLPVFRSADDLPPDCCFVHGVGSPAIKKKLVQKHPGRRWLNVVHPSVMFGTGAVIEGTGNVLQAGTILAPHSRIKNHVTLNLGVIIGHDAVVSDYSTLSPRASIMGNCVVGEGAYIGVGAAVREKIDMGEWSVIGMNAAVVKDVPPYTVVGGVPAKVIKEIAHD